MAAPTNLIVPGRAEWSLYLPDKTTAVTVDASTKVLATGVFSAAQQTFMNNWRKFSVRLELEWDATTVGTPVAEAQLEYQIHGSTQWGQVLGMAGVVTGAAGVAGKLPGVEFRWEAVPYNVEQFRIAWYNTTLSAGGGGNNFTIVPSLTFLTLVRLK